MSLFARVVGVPFHAMPEAVRRFHHVTGRHLWRGEAAVRRGRGPMARLIAGAMGFPPEGDGPLTLTLERDGDGETWTRDFGGHVLRSRLAPAGPGRIAERFGPSSVLLAPVASAEGLDLPSPGALMFGLPVLRLLAPVSDSTERADGARFLFDVRGSVPAAGLVVHYRGWLEEA